jgi:hypothetical protein
MNGYIKHRVVVTLAVQEATGVLRGILGPYRDKVKENGENT